MSPTPEVPPQDLRQRVYAGFDQNWPPGLLQPAVRAVVETVQRAGVEFLGPRGLAVRTSKFREIGGIPPTETVIDGIDLGTGAVWVVLTGRGLWWVQKGATVVVPYREFALRGFRAVATKPGGPVAHVDLGDGVPRLAGVKANQVYRLLTALQDRLREG